VSVDQISVNIVDQAGKACTAFTRVSVDQISVNIVDVVAYCHEATPTPDVSVDQISVNIVDGEG